MLNLPRLARGETAPYTPWVHHEAKEGKGAEVAARLLGVGLAIRNEPGNVHVTVDQDRTSPADVLVYESYRDLAAYQEHEGALHRNASIAALGDLLTGPFEVTHLQVAE